MLVLIISVPEFFVLLRRGLNVSIFVLKYSFKIIGSVVIRKWNLSLSSIYVSAQL